MTKQHLKALAMLPQVIEALTVLAGEAETVRGLMAKLGPLPTPQRPARAPTPPPQPPAQPAPSANDYEPGMDEAEAQAKPLSPAQEDRLEEQRLYLEQQKARREALLAQFAKDDGPVAVVETLRTVSGS